MNNSGTAIYLNVENQLKCKMLLVHYKIKHVIEELLQLHCGLIYEKKTYISKLVNTGATLYTQTYFVTFNLYDILVCC